jgi:hypothetical protein
MNDAKVATPGRPGKCKCCIREGRMLLKKSLLQRGKSFDSFDYEGIGGFRHDGHPNGTGTVVL